MAKKESFVKMFAVLMFTCLISGALLAYTYNKTKENIAKAEAGTSVEAVKKLFPDLSRVKDVLFSFEGEENKAYIALNENGKPMGVAVPSSAIGYGGAVNILVGIGTDGKIAGLELLSHQETPGLGSKAGSEEFREQFKGRYLKNESDILKVDKDGGEIKAITAATITSRAVTRAATKALKIFMKNKESFL